MFTIDGLIWMLLAVVLVFAAIQQAGDDKTKGRVIGIRATAKGR